MTNANCLEGYRCPDCGQDDRLLVVGVAEFSVTDDGSEAVGNHEWSDDSPARCPRCGWGGVLNDFCVPTDLPPDPEGMNDDRARWAGAALAAFRAETGADREDALGDLLGDLMHWCDRAGFDFGAALDRARMHYEAETQPEGEETAFQTEQGADQ